MEALFNTTGAISYAAVQAGLNWILLGLAVTVLVGLLLSRRGLNSASGRYLVWWATLCLVIVIPLRVSLDSQRSSEPAVISAPIHRTGATTGEPEMDLEVIDGSAIAFTARPRLPVQSLPTTSAEPPLSAPAEAVSATTLFLSLLPISLTLTWILLSLLLVGRLVVGLVRLRRIKTMAQPLDAEYQARLRVLSERAGLRRQVLVAGSDMIGTPVAAGLTRPVILIPTGLEEELTPGELDLVLLHELVHIRRRDDWSRLVQTAIQAVCFFHPAILWINRRLDLEREIACDERVVALTGNRSAYARCLTRLVQLSTTNRPPALMEGAILTRKQIHRRFEMIFQNKKSAGRASQAGVIVSLLALAFAAVVAVRVAPVVALPHGGLTYTETMASIDSLIGLEQDTEESPLDLADAAGAGFASTSPASDSDTKNDRARAEHEAEEQAAAAREAEAARDARAAASQEERAAAVESAQQAESERSAVRERRRAVAEIHDNDNFFARAFQGLFGNSHGMSITYDDDGETRVSWSKGKWRVKVRMAGEIEFTDDDRSIKSLSRDAYFEISERGRSVRRELEVEPGAAGQPVFIYTEDGDEAEFDAEAQQWFGELLIDVMRQTGFNAEDRVRRIIARDGVDGVIDEMEAIESDYVTRIYFTALVTQGDLDTEDLNRVLRLAARRMDSDYEKAELAIEVAGYSHGSGKGLVEAYVDLVETLDSDYETRRVLSALALEKPVKQEVMIDILRIARHMDSDYETAELLIGMAELSRGDSALRAAYVNAVRKISSDYEKRRVLSALGLNRNADASLVADLLAIANDMDSDYEKAELLIELAEHSHTDGAVYLACLTAAASLDSDYETKRVLTEIGMNQDMSDTAAAVVQSIIEGMDSDYEKTEVLLTFQDGLTGNDLVLDRYIAAVRTIESNYESGRALQGIVSRSDLSDEQVITLLETISLMSSDYEKGKLLQELGRRCRGDDNLEEAFLDAADTMDSDYERDRAYGSLHRSRRADTRY